MTSKTLVLTTSKTLVLTPTEAVAWRNGSSTGARHGLRRLAEEIAGAVGTCEVRDVAGELLEVVGVPPPKKCAGCGAVHADLGKLPLISYAGARWHAYGAVAVEVRRCTCDQPIAREVPMPWAADVFEEREVDLRRAFAGVEHRNPDGSEP